MKPRRLIGLTGTNGAGKGEVAKYFLKKGYHYFSLSDLLREELQKRGEAITRDSLIRLGNELRRQGGADILAKMIMKKVSEVDGPAVIDSLRNPAEINYLRQQGNFFLIAVDAPVEVRFARIKARGRDESVKTLEEFIAKENEEMSDQSEAQQLQKCLEMADLKIWNDGSLEELYAKLEKIK
ncbi:MAG: AAA family ATPase [Candidatus Aminicenantes bacterium]|nr:AAA family ATPase [Candidatus Aminicenantes bacterium]